MTGKLANDVERRLAGAIGRLPVTRAARLLALVPMLIGPPVVAVGLSLYLLIGDRPTAGERDYLQWTLLIAAINIVASIAIWSAFAHDPFDVLRNVLRLMGDVPESPGGTREMLRSV